MSHLIAPPELTIVVELDVDVFPARIEKRGSRVLGGLAAFFGGSFTILPTVALSMAVAGEGWSRDAAEAIGWFVIPFALFLALLVWGIDQFLRRATVLLDGHEVRWCTRSVRGSTELVEPLANFAGIHGRKRSNSDDGTLYELLLQHQDASLTVLLYRADGPAGFFDRWKRYCRVFHRPPIEYLAPTEPFSRDVDDLGQSLITLIRDGKLAVPDPGPRPEHVLVDHTGDHAVIRVATGETLTVSGQELRVGSGDELVCPVEWVDTITIEPGPPPSRKPWLKLAYRRRIDADGEAPEALSLSAPLAHGMPLKSLQWLQRFLLRRLAGIEPTGLER